MSALIAAQRDEHRIPCAAACRALGVSRSWYYKWASGRLAPRAARRQRLKAEVARLFGLHEGKYGSPRITADLRDAGWRVSENTVAALMRELGLAARLRDLPVVGRLADGTEPGSQIGLELLVGHLARDRGAQVRGLDFRGFRTRPIL